MLKERVDGPEDEVSSGACLAECWLQAWGSVLLKGFLVGCGPNRSGCKDDQETC